MALVGRYETYEQLGVGSIGTIYRARDSVLGREVALRILNANARFSSRLTRSFEENGQITSEWLHPNIAIIYDLGQAAVGPFVATELLSGADMRSYIRSRSALSLPQKLDLLAQASNGLAHAHQSRIIHAALKPGSFFIDEGQQVKLLNLGIRYVSIPDDQASHQSGLLDYFSPEQLAGGPCDARCDVFSAAVVFYEFLVNIHPFRNPSIAERIASDAPDPLLRHDPSLPKSLEVLLNQALEKSPAKRIQTAAELAAGFRAIEAEMLSGVAPRLMSVPEKRPDLHHTSVIGPLPSLPDRAPHKSPWADLSPFGAKLLATAAFAVCVLLAAYFVSQNKQPHKQKGIAEAQVRPEDTNLFESPDPQSRIVTQLHRGGQVEILDHAPTPGERFAHAQFTRGQKTIQIGYILTTDLWNWRSGNPNVAWDLLRLEQPQPLAPADDVKIYLASLQSFIDRFPDSQEAGEAKVTQQRFSQIISPTTEALPLEPAPPSAQSALPSATPEQEQKSRKLLEPVPALWEDGNLEKILELTKQAIDADPANAAAKQWRGRAQKALRKLNDQ